MANKSLIWDSNKNSNEAVKCFFTDVDVLFGLKCKELQNVISVELIHL